MQNYTQKHVPSSLIPKSLRLGTTCTGQTHPLPRPEINYLLTHLRKLEKVLERVTLKLRRQKWNNKRQSRNRGGHLEQSVQQHGESQTQAEGKKKHQTRGFPVGPVVKNCLAVQGTLVDLVWAGPHAQEQLIPVHNYWDSSWSRRA